VERRTRSRSKTVGAPGESSILMMFRGLELIESIVQCCLS